MPAELTSINIRLNSRLTSVLTLDAALLSAHVSLDGRRLLTLTSVRGGEVCVWSTHNFTRLACLPCAAPPCIARLTPCGRLVVTGGMDGALAVWSIDAQRQERALQLHADQILDIAFADSDRHMFVSSADCSVSRWDWSTGAF